MDEGDFKFASSMPVYKWKFILCEGLHFNFVKAPNIFQRKMQEWFLDLNGKNCDTYRRPVKFVTKY